MNTVEKLKVLLKVVKDVPEGRFNMETFITQKDCGTTCCALGALALSPEGREMGLRTLTYDSGSPLFFIMYIDEGNIAGDYMAGAKALGITIKQAYNLFDPSTYTEDDEESIPKIEVIERIEDLIWELENE